MAKLKLRWTSFHLVAALALGLLAAPWSQAAEKPALTLKTTLEKEVTLNKDGKNITERQPADETHPGDTLVITVVYLNDGRSEAREAVILNPVPQGTSYVIGSAGGLGAMATFSTDQGRTFHPEPVLVAEKAKDGTSHQRPARPEEYTQLKWTIATPIPPGGTGSVTFKAIVK